jgi:hypothetical protein
MQFMPASKVSSSKKKPSPDNDNGNAENSFSEEDFLLLAEILDEQTKQRQSGVKKPRISTNSQSLNELLELL